MQIVTLTPLAQTWYYIFNPDKAFFSIDGDCLIKDDLWRQGGLTPDT